MMYNADGCKINYSQKGMDALVVQQYAWLADFSRSNNTVYCKGIP